MFWDHANEIGFRYYPERILLEEIPSGAAGRQGTLEARAQT
jgi:hypothetical protein